MIDKFFGINFEPGEYCIEEITNITKSRKGWTIFTTEKSVIKRLNKISSGKQYGNGFIYEIENKQLVFRKNTKFDKS